MESSPYHGPLPQSSLTSEDQIPCPVLAKKKSLWPDLQIGQVAENVFITWVDQD